VVDLTRPKLIAVILLTLLSGFVVGAAVAGTFSIMFMSSANVSRNMADAFVYLMALEKLQSGDTVRTQKILHEQLQAAVFGLQVQSDRLSPSETEKLHRIQARVDALEGKETLRAQ
jgi:RNA 3'-terminal phosphate cyclase